MSKYNVSYDHDYQAEDGMLFITATVENGHKELLEYLERRVDNYYDANGLNQIEVNGNELNMWFEVETDEEVQDTLDSVGGYISFVLGCLEAQIIR